MKKTSTHTLSQSDEKKDDSRRACQPRTSTIAFLRQFARAYCPANNAALPGIVLN